MIPDYNEAVAIVKKCGELKFYESIFYIDGYKISFFNYRIVGYNDFIENDAQELRGLCFVFNRDGSLYRRYILMHKFFNLNQVEETQLFKLETIRFKYVHDKADGSVINFIELPNGKILAKSKVYLDNDQTKMAQEIFDNSDAIKSLVRYCIDNDIMPIFELVSPRNRVVLKYTETDLILTRLRKNSTGEYIDFETLNNVLTGINCIKSESYSSFHELISLSEKLEHKEGWVVTLENNMLVKVKTEWYRRMHHLYTDCLSREDYIISMILDEKIDDIISQLSEEDKEVKAMVDKIVSVIQKYIENTTIAVNCLIENFNTVYKRDRKSFAIAEKKNKYFPYCCSVLDGQELYTVLVKDIKKNTYFLEKARNFIETGDIK